MLSTPYSHPPKWVDHNPHPQIKSLTFGYTPSTLINTSPHLSAPPFQRCLTTRRPSPTGLTRCWTVLGTTWSPSCWPLRRSWWWCTGCIRSWSPSCCADRCEWCGGRGEGWWCTIHTRSWSPLCCADRRGEDMIDEGIRGDSEPNTASISFSLPVPFHASTTPKLLLLPPSPLTPPLPSG